MSGIESGCGGRRRRLTIVAGGQGSVKKVTNVR